MRTPFRYLALTALLSSPLLVQAQSTAPASGWQKSIGLHLTPTVCYRTLSGSSEETFIINTRDDIERSRIGFDAGTTLRLTHNEHLTLDAGLSFASRGYQVVMSPSNMKVNDPGMWPNVKIWYKYQYISLPLQVSYSLGQGRLRGFVGGGVSLDFLLGVQDKRVYENNAPESSFETTGYRRGNVTPRLTAGVRYALTPTYSVELAPVLQYSLLGSRIHGTMNEHLYSAGLNVGLYRQF